MSTTSAGVVVLLKALVFVMGNAAEVVSVVVASVVWKEKNMCSVGLLNAMKKDLWGHYVLFSFLLIIFVIVDVCKDVA